MDFLSVRAGQANMGMALADGAVPATGCALALDDEAWGEFQEQFASVK